MKKLTVTILAAGALLGALSPAFAEQTITSPTIPDPRVVEPNGGFFSETWFALGVSGADG